MSESTKQIHNRRSIRIPGYDYSSCGAYFVTICAHNRENIYGEIVDGKMVVNDAGKMAEKWWNKIPEKYPHVELFEYVTMPNHFHGILSVRAAPCGRPKGQPRRAAPTLGDIIGWFKTMTTNEYIRSVKQFGWRKFNKRLWQRNYYERIIRNDDEMLKTRDYIINNPEKWDLDKDNTNRTE